MDDEYLTLASISEGYYMDRGSKFYAYASPVSTEIEANQWLTAIKKEHPKARHFCSALRLFPEATLERSNDDGEPSGSAGKPILGQLIKNNLTYVMVIVARYFGGTKLGVPGLIEAYRTSAVNAIVAGNIIKRKVYGAVRIEMAYEQVPLFINHCRQTGVLIFGEEYMETALITLGFSRSTLRTDLIETLHQFSQMDFNSLEDYSRYLQMTVTTLTEEKIL